MKNNRRFRKFIGTKKHRKCERLCNVINDIMKLIQVLCVGLISKNNCTLKHRFAKEFSKKVVKEFKSEIRQTEELEIDVIDDDL